MTTRFKPEEMQLVTNYHLFSEFGTIVMVRWFWRLASSKFAGWASRLETHIAVQVQRLSLGRIPPCSGGVSLWFFSGLQPIG